MPRPPKYPTQLELSTTKADEWEAYVDMRFGAQVAGEREKRGWGVSVAAKHLGIPMHRLCRIESGSIAATRVDCLKIAEGYGLHPRTVLAWAAGEA